MNKKNIKYSILIPTFNKDKYLQHTIKSILDNDYKNFELIISDDFSTDDTNKVLSEINDSRVKIIKPPFKLTQTKNYEFILSHAQGEWITILGDDDGVLPDFFDQLDKYTKKYPDIEAIQTKPAIYYWENVEDLYGDRVCDYQNFRTKPKIKNSKISLLLALAGMAQRIDLPMIYTTGLIKKKLVDRIKKKSNNFFFYSVIPDYYSMISILYETKNFLQINEPIFWVGVSNLSTGRGVKIYADDTKNQEIVLNDYKFINPHLKLHIGVSSLLHKIGLSSIYFFECALNHPYLEKKWKSKIIKYLVYASSNIHFHELFYKTRFRIKIKITREEFLNEVDLELKKNNLSKLIYLMFIYLLKIFNFYKKIIKFYTRMNNFIKKKTSNSPIILVSKNRNQFRSISDCNIVLIKKLKN